MIRQRRAFGWITGFSNILIGPSYLFLLTPVSRLWSCQSGESNLRARINGDVQAGIRLRPVNSLHQARKKGSPRYAVKLSFRKIIKTVPNFLQKNFFKEAISIKNTIWAFKDFHDAVSEIIVDFYSC